MVRKVFRVECDGCRVQYDGEGGTKKLVQMIANGDGWKVVGRKDFCPDCQPKEG